MVILINANHMPQILSNHEILQNFLTTFKRNYLRQVLCLSTIVNHCSLTSQYAFKAKSYIVNASAVIVHERDCSHAFKKKKITFFNVYVRRILKFGHLFMKTPENPCKQTRKTRNKRMDDNFSLEPPYSFLSIHTHKSYPNE